MNRTTIKQPLGEPQTLADVGKGYYKVLCSLGYTHLVAKNEDEEVCVLDSHDVRPLVPTSDAPYRALVPLKRFTVLQQVRITAIEAEVM